MPAPEWVSGQLNSKAELGVGHRPGIQSLRTGRIGILDHVALVSLAVSRTCTPRLVFPGGRKYMGTLLEPIHSPADLKCLNFAQMEELAAEIREFLIQTQIGRASCREECRSRW